MVRNINKATLLGHVGKEPAFRVAVSGSEGATFSLATTKKWKDKQGTWQSKTDWHKITTWSPNLIKRMTSEALSKGDLVYVEGTISSDTWTDKEGKNRTTVFIMADEISVVKKAAQSQSNGFAGAHIPSEPMGDCIPF